MRVHDEALWQEQCAELEADGEMGQVFRQFLEAWVVVAEDWVETMAPAVALRTALAPTEETLGRAHIGLLGQMLVVIAGHWIHNEELAEGLTPIELRLLQDTLAVKIAALQAEAAEGGDQ